MPKLLYISGGMTGYPEFNFPAFYEAARKLRAAGFAVLNPADKGIIEGWAWVDYLRYDLVALLRCDAVAMLPGWHASRGAKLEVDVAERLGMPCKAVGHWLGEWA